jgi:hypothetical protein
MTAHIDPTTTVREFDVRRQVVELVEDATRHVSFCNCGETMTVEAEGDTLLLECPTFMAPSTGRLAWLWSGIRVALHERLVIAREVGIAA